MDGDLVVELFKIRNKEYSDQNIDLIIMDLNMINMDGDEATRQVNYFRVY
jgi:CheY-like chemotaxis protein